jgi:hypothetical protein
MVTVSFAREPYHVWFVSCCFHSLKDSRTSLVFIIVLTFKEKESSQTAQLDGSDFLDSISVVHHRRLSQWPVQDIMLNFTGWDLLVSPSKRIYRRGVNDGANHWRQH